MGATHAGDLEAQRLDLRVGRVHAVNRPAEDPSHGSRVHEHLHEHDALVVDDGAVRACGE